MNRNRSTGGRGFRARLSIRSTALPAAVSADTPQQTALTRRPGSPATSSLTNVPASEEALPSPPTGDEKYWYFGREHRWLFPVSVLVYSLVCVSMALFATSRTVLWLLLVPLAFSLITIATSMRTSLRRRGLQLTDHRLRVERWLPDSVPAVDVFLPSAGESMAILHNTFRHVAALSWPGTITVYVLDDSARPEVRHAAAGYGFTYLSRPDPGYLKKAGNLRYGFEHSDGDFIAIFDADFVPRPEFLLELLPYFDDPSTGIVQSPQFFDSDTGLHWIQRSAGATQEMFYRWIQTSRDRFDSAICVGTCAVYRRRALEKSGGFAQIGHSEDVHTGVSLMKAGFTTRYVPVLLAKGLCPEEFAAFVNQQYRWCSGSLSLLRDPTFRRHEAITLRHHLCFFAGFLYYLIDCVERPAGAAPGNHHALVAHACDPPGQLDLDAWFDDHVPADLSVRAQGALEVLGASCAVPLLVRALGGGRQPFHWEDKGLDCNRRNEGLDADRVQCEAGDGFTRGGDGGGRLARPRTRYVDLRMAPVLGDVPARGGQRIHRAPGCNDRRPSSYHTHARRPSSTRGTSETTAAFPSTSAREARPGSRLDREGGTHHGPATRIPGAGGCLTMRARGLEPPRSVSSNGT